MNRPPDRERMSLSVTRWLVALVAGGILGMLVLTGVGKWQMERVYQNTYANIDTAARVGAIRDARAHLANLRLLLYRHLVSADSTLQTQLETQIALEQTATLALLQQYGARLSDATDARMLDAERALLNDYLQDIPETLAYSRIGDSGAALALLRQQLSTGEELGSALDRHVQYTGELGRRNNAHLAQVFAHAFRAAVFFVVAVILALLGAGFIISRRLMRQVDRMRTLGQQNALFHSLVEMIHEPAITVHDPSDGARVVFANAAACRHFGMSREMLLGSRQTDWDLTADAAQLARITETLRRQKSLTLETLHRTAAGDAVPVEVLLNGFDYEGTSLAVGFIRDLRPRKEAEARMLEYERSRAQLESAGRLSRFADSAPGMMFTYQAYPAAHDSETQGRVQGAMPYVSQGIEDVLGLHVEDVKHDVSALTALIHADDLPLIVEAAQASRHALAALTLAFRIAHPGKGQRWLQARCMPDRREDGSTQWHGFIYDITERKQLEERLRSSEQEFRTLIENSPDMVVRYDRQFRRIFMNPAFEKSTGTSIQASQGQSLDALWRPENIDADAYKAGLRLVMESGEPRDILLEWTAADGQQVSHIMRVVPEYDSRGHIVSALGIGHNISRLKAAEHALRQRELYQRAVLDNFPFFVWLKDTESRLLAANIPYARMAKVASTQELEGKTDFDFFPHDLAQQYVADDRTVLASGQPKNVVEMYHDEHGQYRWLETYKSPVMLDGRVIGTVGFARDVTEKKRMEMELVQREQELRTLIENTPDTIARYDRDCRRVFANSTLAAISGVPVQQLLDKTPSEFPGGASSQAYEQAIRHVLANGEAGSFELAWRSDGGRDLCTHVRLTPELDAAGQIVSVLAVGRDLTEIDSYRQRIHRLAFFDALTELPNRELLTDRIRQTVADASWHGHQFGLMLLDLDRFKEVNDTLGHGVGDLLLREVADRLLECVRSYDTVARLGGDEFAILLPEVRIGDDLATIARKIMDAFQQPFLVTGKELFISASIGIALYPGDSAEIDALFKYADSAMYHAKKQGRNNFQYYARELTTRSSERLLLETALRKAAKMRELELYYQPQVDLASGAIIGAEALLRWNHPEHGLVSPDKFIPLAEETGLIVGIGEWILDSACRAAVAWNRGRATPFKVAVNLSTRQFIQNDLLGSIYGTLIDTECKPEWLKLEITESLLLEDSRDVVAILEKLDAMGLAISIDDFGTGYSALSYLNQFPVSQIKIDRSFVQGIPEQRDKSELVKAMISIAQALQLELVAEGVETAQQADYLHAHGCGIAQGYLFGKPMPHPQFDALLAARHSGEAA